MTTSTDALHRLVEAVQRRDAVAYAMLYAEGAVGIHPLSPEPIRGRAEIEASERALFDAFSDVEVTVQAVVADARTCAGEVVLKAVNTGPLDLGAEQPLPPTGRTIELPATWWIEVDDDGLIVSERDYFDTMALMAQLGLAGDEA